MDLDECVAHSVNEESVIVEQTEGRKVGNIRDLPI